MFITVLTQVFILLILILTGFVLARFKVLNETGVKCMTELVLIVVAPCVIVKSFCREFNQAALRNFLISVLIALLIHIGFALCVLLLKDKDDTVTRVLRFGVVFGNCGFMSLPLQQALLGEDGVFFGSSFIAVFNLFVWSYGILLMSGDKKKISVKKLILNPGIIGIVIGLIVFFFSIPLPKVIAEPIAYLAALNTPVPMIIIGYHMAQSNLLDGLKSLKCMLAIALKLFFLPLAALFIMVLAGVRGTMLVSSVISCSAPTAAMTTMFAARYGKDTGLSVNMVSLSTVLSLISMPILITIAEFFA